jgi:hypothetical protein
MAHSFRTNQTKTGFNWAVVAIEYGQPETILKSGTASTRAKATGAAKRWTLFFRRGGVA